MDINSYASLASAVIAGLALIISIYVLYRQRKDSIPKLQIISPCSVPKHQDEGCEHSPLIVYLVSNSGPKPIYIFELSLHAPSIGFVAPLRLNDLKLPHRLEPCEGLEVNSVFDEHLEELVRQCIEEGGTEGLIVIRDGEWKTYKSEVFSLNIDDISVFSDESFYATCPKNPDKGGFFVKRSVNS